MLTLLTSKIHLSLGQNVIIILLKTILATLARGRQSRKAIVILLLTTLWFHLTLPQWCHSTCSQFFQVKLLYHLGCSHIQHT